MKPILSITGLCLVAITMSACAAFDAPRLSIEVDGGQQVVGVPFTATVDINADQGTYFLVIGYDEALAESSGAMIPREELEVDKGGESQATFEYELVCLHVESSAEVVAVLDGDGTASDKVTIDCVASMDEGDTDDAAATEDTGDTGDTGEPQDTETTGDTGDTDDTGGMQVDADVLAFDFAEYVYAISLGDPPSQSEGTSIAVQTQRARAEREGNGYRVLAHYQAGPTEAGVLYGIIEDDLDVLERFEFAAGTFLVDNAFNGTEFVHTDLDAGIYLFDGTTVTQANAPSGAGAVECDGLVCVAAAQPLGVLRSEDGGANWVQQPGQDYALAGVAYGDGLFVAYDSFNGQILVSDDGGQSWTAGTIDGANGPSPIEFGGGTFVGPDVATGTILYSHDGATWQAGTTPIGINEVSYSERAQAWVGISAAGSLHAVMSSDGETWEELDGVMGQSIFSTIVGLD